MTWLAEDPLPVWLVGALLLTFALVVYLQARTSWSVWAMAAVVVLVGLLTIVEWLWLTPREQVERTLREVLVAVEEDDLPRTLSYLAPSAVDSRTDAETLMPRLDIYRARALDTPQIVVNGDEATVNFRAFIKARDKSSGADGGYLDDVQVRFEYDGRRWLVSEVRPAKPWQSGDAEGLELQLP